MRPDFSMRAPHALRDRDTDTPRNVESPRKKKHTKKHTKKHIDAASRDVPGAGAPVGAGANVAGNTPALGAQGNPKLTPSARAALENLRRYIDGLASASEFQAMKDLIDAILAGGGPIVVPPIVAGAPNRGRGFAAGSMWKPGDDLPNPTPGGLGPVTPQDGSGKPGAPWEANLQDLPAYANSPEGRARRERENKRQWLLGGGEMHTPNSGFTDKSSQVADGWTRDAGGSTGIIPFVDLTVAVEHDEHGNYRFRMGATLDGDGNHRGNYGIIDIKVTKDADVSTSTTSGDSEDIVVTPVVPTPVGSGNDPSKDPAPDGDPGRPRGGSLAQVVARFGGRLITCNIGGCVASVVQGRTIDPDRPDDGAGTSTTTTTSPGPGPATDPCPDCDSGRVGGNSGGRVGYRPQDESAGGPQGGSLGTEGGAPSPIAGGAGGSPR